MKSWKPFGCPTVKIQSRFAISQPLMEHQFWLKKFKNAIGMEKTRKINRALNAWSKLNAIPSIQSQTLSFDMIVSHIHCTCALCNWYIKVLETNSIKQKMNACLLVACKLAFSQNERALHKVDVAWLMMIRMESPHKMLVHIMDKLTREI